MMKFAVFAASAVSALRISPGAIGGSDNDGSAAIGAATGGSGIFQQLANLVGPLATSGGSMGRGNGMAGGFPAPNGKEAAVRDALVDAEKTFAAAADVHEDAKTMEIQSSIAAALQGAAGSATGSQDASGATSFLQSPMSGNGFKYRNALFTSQLLRTPSAARINVITKNNGHGSGHGASAWGTAQTAEDLQRQFAAGLASLEH